MITNEHINRAIDYILLHIEDVTLEEVAAYQTIFLVWLPRTSYELDAKRSMFDIYHMVDTDTKYMELDICLPIK